MFERINYLWRLFGTGLSFFLFGAVGVLVWGGLFPMFEKRLGDGLQKKLRSRHLMCQIFLAYMNFMRTIGILTYEVRGGKKLNEPGRLVIANHPSLLDIVFLISQIRNATCIVKPALVNNPFMRIPIRAMGYIYAENAESLLELCAAELHEGGSLIIFPEGTRTTPGQTSKFQRGAAAIALHAGVKVLPVQIGCTPTTLTKQEKWYQIPPRKFTLSLDVGEDIDPGLLCQGMPRSLATRHLTRHFERLLGKRTAGYGHA